MEAVLDIKKQISNQPAIKRIEIEYGEENYIIVNLVEHVIDVDGKLWEYTYDKDVYQTIYDLTWSFRELDEYEYWPDKSKDHAPMSPIWRISFYDEFNTYYHKSGALSMCLKLMELIDVLKELK